MNITVSNNELTTPPSSIEFSQLVETALNAVGAKSQRVYLQTYHAWQMWADENGVEPTSLNPIAVKRWLDSGDYSIASKKRMKSALVKMARMAAIISPEYRTIADYLREVKVEHIEGQGKERETKALTAGEVHEVLSAYRGDRAIDKRNRAILAVLFYTGLRRSELSALKWSDIDLGAGTVNVRHGKRDKSRVVPVMGQDGINALLEWREICPQGRVYAFCALDKGGNPGKDRPLPVRIIYTLAKEHDFAPHDARRTLITNALNNGASVADVQTVAGHERADTTLRYAKVKDGVEAGKRIKLGY